MNDQEMNQKNSIEKREKTDTMISYTLIVVLLLCIGILVYLKYTKSEPTPDVTDNIPVPAENNTIRLVDISKDLNDSDLINEYKENNEEISSSVNGNKLVITYKKDDNNKEYSVPLNNDELEFNVEEDDTVIEDIYKEVAYIICTYYGELNSACKTAANSIDKNTTGVRIVEKDNSKLVYISTKDTIVLAGNVSNNTSTNTSTSSTATENTDKSSSENTSTSNSNLETESDKEEITEVTTSIG